MQLWDPRATNSIAYRQRRTLRRKRVATAFTELGSESHNIPSTAPVKAVPAAAVPVAVDDWERRGTA
jgi:hypothetical protein